MAVFYRVGRLLPISARMLPSWYNAVRPLIQSDGESPA